MLSTSGERNFSLQASNRIEVENDSPDEDEQAKNLFIEKSNENNLKSNVVKLWEIPYSEKVVQDTVPNTNTNNNVEAVRVEEAVVQTEVNITQDIVNNNTGMVVETEQIQVSETVIRNEEVVGENV